MELIPRRGFQVAPLNGDDSRDLFQIQGLIAGELAARAAAAATDKDIEELEALHHELLSAAGQKDQLLLKEKNHAFHREINLIAGSRTRSHAGAHGCMPAGYWPGSSPSGRQPEGTERMMGVAERCADGLSPPGAAAAESDGLLEGRDAI